SKDKWSKCSPVESFETNGYGLYDMAGNVWEWCADWYGSDYYSKSPARSPKGAAGGSRRVLRGGSWSNNAHLLRVSHRVNSRPDARHFLYGFRCVSGLD
ncbi:MAG: SUMF1/EgtB/PvdO family nonheme iron enzyme, partial [Candidatus Poribacteria bacterium]|nr:SUMF1/EgtB/PvdO family nonheme iron enzyme [Candidatus Poribacteria bacterium]